jgi:hypothetical protein
LMSGWRFLGRRGKEEIIVFEIERHWISIYRLAYYFGIVTFFPRKKVTKCRFTASRPFWFLEREKSLEIVTLVFNPNRTRHQFRCNKLI